MADRGETLKSFDVSRETRERLGTYERLLRQWTKVTNLIGPSEMDSLWSRHFVDSLQLASLADHGKAWVDMGTGAGFPGLVLAINAVGDRATHVDLIEPDGRKCAFLREVIRETGANATVHRARAEDVLGELERVDIITSRAMAPLENLVGICEERIRSGAIGLFPKGRGYRAEVAAMSGRPHLTLAVHPSVTSTDAAIVQVMGTGSENGGAA